jgi:excisionase family DNA binding protein
MPVRDLATHSARYVTIAELAEYWIVSRQQIYKRIESGALAAIKLGPRLFRVRTAAALEYERHASVAGDFSFPPQKNDKLPITIAFQRVIRKSISD